MTAVVMTLYEFIKRSLLPPMTILESHEITIIFTSALAPFVSYFFLKKIQVMRLKLLEKITNETGSNIIYKTMVEMSPDALVTMDISGYILSCNSAAEKQMGRSNEEIVGKHFSEIGMKPGDIPKNIKFFASLLLGGSAEYLEQEMIRKDGSSIWVEVRFALLKEADQIIGIQIIARDISERRKMKEKLKENEERYRTLVESASDQIFMFDEGYKVVSMNSAASMLSGKKPDEMIGKHISEIFSGEMLSKNINNLGTVFKTGRNYSVEEVLSIGGHKIYVSTSLSPVKNMEGKTTAVLGVVRDITESKNAEKELIRSKNFIEKIYNNIDIPVSVIDVDSYKFVSANKALLDELKVEEKDLIGKHCYEVTHHRSSPCEPPNDICPIKEALRTGKKACAEHKHFTEDGREIYVNVTAIPLNDEKNEIHQVIHISEDVTLQRNAERAVRESEQTLKAIFDSANDGILVAGIKDKKFTNYNKTICEMTGYTPEEIKALGVIDIHPREDLPYVIDQFEKQARNEIRVARDIPVKRKDGSVFYADVNSSPVNISGEICLLGLFRDITERNKAEAEIKSSEERLKILFECAPDAYYLNDLAGNIVDGNQAAEKLLGYKKEELIGKNLLKVHLLPIKEVVKAASLLLKNTMGKSTGPDEFNLKRKDGSLVPVEISTHPVKIDGKTMVLGIARDITTRKKAEETKEGLFKKLEEANRNKTQFVSDVSHELRTPLASIKGFVSTVRSDAEMDKKTREDFLKIAEDEADRLTRIIEDLLDLSRIESGRIKLSPRSFQLSDLVVKSVDSIKNQAEKKGIEIKYEKIKDVPLVFADQDKTSQIIINLLSNAIKYNRQNGKIDINIKEDADKVSVEVADTGFGISDADIPRMFEKFFRGEKASTETEGTGLGLAVTKSLVELQGGKINVESRVNEGSKFSFTLPVSGRSTQNART